MRCPIAQLAQPAICAGHVLLDIQEVFAIVAQQASMIPVVEDLFNAINARVTVKLAQVEFALFASLAISTSAAMPAVLAITKSMLVLQYNVELALLIAMSVLIHQLALLAQQNIQVQLVISVRQVISEMEEGFVSNARAT